MRNIRILLAAGLIIFGIVCLGTAASSVIGQNREAESLAALAENKQQEMQESERETEPVTEAETTTEAVVETTERPKTEEELRREANIAERLAVYEKLDEENEDFYGWLTIPDTVIDYPVMFTPEDPEYYLNRNFEGEKSASGVPFLTGVTNTETTYNYLIHGHNMKNKTMFSTLLKYETEKYYQEHPVIYFDTETEVGEYQVVAACRTRIFRVNEDGFRYYNYVNIETEEQFNEYMDGICDLALYDTGVEVEFGDELITLSTCAYHVENGRFIVVAKKLPVEESGRWDDIVEMRREN